MGRGDGFGGGRWRPQSTPPSVDKGGGWADVGRGGWRPHPVPLPVDGGGRCPHSRYVSVSRTRRGVLGHPRPLRGSRELGTPRPQRWSPQRPSGDPSYTQTRRTGPSSTPDPPASLFPVSRRCRTSGLGAHPSSRHFLDRKGVIGSLVSPGLDPEGRFGEVGSHGPSPGRNPSSVDPEEGAPPPSGPWRRPPTGIPKCRVVEDLGTETPIKIGKGVCSESSRTSVVSPINLVVWAFRPACPFVYYITIVVHINPFICI